MQILQSIILVFTWSKHWSFLFEYIWEMNINDLIKCFYWPKRLALKGELETWRLIKIKIFRFDFALSSKVNDNLI